MKVRLRPEVGSEDDQLLDQVDRWAPAFSNDDLTLDLPLFANECNLTLHLRCAATGRRFLSLILAPSDEVETVPLDFE